MNPATAGAADAHRLVAASALSGASGIAPASLLGGRSTVVSRSGDRGARPTACRPLPTPRPSSATQALAAFAAQAEKQAAKIKLNQWVLPVAAGVYHLTARFGDYSSPVVALPHRPRLRRPHRHPDHAVAGGTVT